MNKAWLRFLVIWQGAMDILFNPKAVRERVENINKDIDLHTGFSIIKTAILKEIKPLTLKYPNDITLFEKISEIENNKTENKEDFKEIVNIKKEIVSQKEKTCEICNHKFLYSCNHNQY